MLLYEMCTSQQLFRRKMNDDNIRNPGVKTQLCTWHTINDEDLEDVLIGSSPEVIADAKNLIRWCLKGNPAERPTIEEILSHRFLNPESEAAPENMPVKYHIFISHVQTEASGDCGTLFFLLRQLGVRCWRDMNADDLTEAGMRQGVKDSECVVGPA